VELRAGDGHVVRGVAPPAVLLEHRVADVTTLDRKALVEFVADRRPPNDAAGDVGDEKGRRYPAGRERLAESWPVEPLEVRGPRRIGPEVETKGEPLLG